MRPKCQSLSRRLNGSDVDGQIEINLSTELASAWLPTVLKRYTEKYPKVSIEVIASDQTSDARQQDQIVIRSDFVRRLPAEHDFYFNRFPLCIVCAPELVALNKKTGRDLAPHFNASAYVNNAQVIK